LGPCDHGSEATLKFESVNLDFQGS
jgi:hypothetical protein